VVVTGWVIWLAEGTDAPGTGVLPLEIGCAAAGAGSTVSECDTTAAGAIVVGVV
jgi:hypothetical protein